MFGFLGEDSSRIALRFGGLGIQSGDFGNLLIAPVDRKNKRAKPIRVLASANVKIAPSRILRNRMVRADQVMLDSRRLNDNLKKTPPTVSPSQWTQYLLSQISRFNQLHFLAIVFFGLLLSLYLNHFLRAGILIICGLAMSALVLSPYSITRTAYHIDSLWLLHYVPWLGLVGYVVISRIIDVERSRGNDRDLAVQDARIQFAPTVMMALAFAVIALCVLGILERIPRFSGLGLWHEALWLSAVGVIVVLAMGYHLFPVIYLKSEEILDNLAYWLIRLPIIGKVLRRV